MWFVVGGMALAVAGVLGIVFLELRDLSALARAQRRRPARTERTPFGGVDIAAAMEAMPTATRPAVALVEAADGRLEPQREHVAA